MRTLDPEATSITKVLFSTSLRNLEDTYQSLGLFLPHQQVYHQPLTT